MVPLFRKTLGLAWEQALEDNSKSVLTLTLFTQDDEVFLKEAEELVDTLEKMGGTLRYEFLGASKIGATFPDMAFSVSSNEEANRLHGALSRHLVGSELGYDIRYRTIG